MARHLISEPITPESGSIDTNALARGVPAAPERFTWRDREYLVAATLSSWNSVTPEGSRAGANKYLRRHYFEVRCATGEVMTLYCERKPSAGRNRWWLYTIEERE